MQEDAPLYSLIINGIAWTAVAIAVWIVVWWYVNRRGK